MTDHSIGDAQVSETQTPAPEVTDTLPASPRGADSPEIEDTDTGGLDNSGYPEEAIAEIRKVRNEAKKLRARLREAESAASAAAAALEAMRRTEVQRLAAEHLIDGTDIWTAQTTVEELLSEDGTIDAGKVAETAAAITAAKPHLAAPNTAARPPTDRPIESLRSGASPDRPPQKPDWFSALGSRVVAK